MAEFRSGVYSKPLELTKEDLKNLAKRRQKAIRDEEAKTAKIRPQTDNAPMGSSVSFDAPVKVSNKDLDKDNRKLTDILGPYDRMSQMILSGTRGIVGVESQPATPLPSKTGGGTFFKSQAGKNSVKELYVGNQPSRDRGREPPARRADKPNSATEFPLARMKENNADHRPTLKQDGKPQSVPASHSASSTASVSSNPTEKLNRSDTSRERQRGGGSGCSQKSSNSQKVPQNSESSNQSVKKEISRVIKKEVTDLPPGKPANEDRVPVLQGLKQELIGQSKKDSNQSASSASNSKNLPNQQSHAKGAERTSKKPHSEPVTVLKESKDENRNAINGKFKDRPRLQISQEKNVEDMLRELTHIPQPLTGLPTPSKDCKFPFQEKVTEPLSKRGVKVESKQIVPEEIQEKDDSESSDSADSASGDEANDNDDDDEDGSGDSSDSGDSAKGDKGKNDDDHNDDEDDVDGGRDGNGSSSDSDEEEEEGEVNSDKEDDKLPDKVQPAPAKIPLPVGGNTAVKAPVKAAVKAPPGKQQGPMSSSDSSSSGSESSDSGSDSESVSDPSDTEKPDSPPPPPPEKEKVTPAKIKSTPDYMDDPSPSRQSWNLEAFLPHTRNDASGLLNIAKPLSLEAPSSNKSDPDQVDEVIDVKRSADHVSDENPQSVDRESVSKPMSADEFSPPAPILDKQMLSPIKSPQSVKSPTKRTFHTPSVHDKGHGDTASAKTKSDPPVVMDRYDSIKNRERKKSTSISSPDVIKEPVKQKMSHAGRKAKKRSTPATVPDDTSSSDSEIDINSLSPRKSLSSVSNDNYKLSSVPSKSSSAKVKETKKNKLLKEQNCVKLEQVDDSFPTDCDTLSAKPMSNMPLPMTDIFNYFTDTKVKKPLSPLRDCKNTEKVKHVKPDILPVKNLYNGSVKNLNGKPSVLVQIELNLLTKVMCKDKSDPTVLKIKPEMAKRLKGNLSIGHLKPPKVTTAKGPGAIIANKSHKVLESDEEVSKSLPSASNHSTSNSQASANNSQTSANHSSTDSAKLSVGRSFPESVPKSAVDVNRTAVPDFNSLPVREPVIEPELSESSSSESSSSDSEIEDDSKSSQPALVSSHSTSFNQSPPDNKKRKRDIHRADDSKRRKTLLNSQSTPEPANRRPNHDLNCEPSHDEVMEVAVTNSKKSSSKRERCNSTSSQQSTLSQHSTTSTHSRHSRHGTQGQRSQKKTKLSDPPSDLISSHSAESTAQSSTKSQSSSQSQVKSSPSALSTLSTSSSSKHGRSEVSDSSRKVNGHIPKNGSSVPGRVNNHVLPASLKHGAETEERLLSFSEYHKKATSLRHKAKAMPVEPHSLEKYYVFLDSVLYFLLSGLACERDHQSTMDASNLFKDTHRLMAHHYDQFRNQESDVTDKSDVKFTVLCLRIQSLIYMKLYKLKRTETIKLKKALDDHNNKSGKTTSQPKPPSAPSPHQTNWNRSTGTPSPMSPTPSPANSICSVGSVGSDQTPSKLTNGTSNSAPIAPPGFILVPQRIHSITQKYFTSTNYLVQAHELWDQSESTIIGDLKDFFVQLDTECGNPLTINSSLIHLVKYCRRGLSHLRSK